MMDYNPFTLSQRHILVTGASSGIGKAIAVECSKMGATVYATARNEERLAECYAQLDSSEGQIHRSIIADLLQPEDLEHIMAVCPKLDGLVLSVGKGLTLPFQYSTREKFEEIFNLNLFAPIELMRLLYKRKLLQRNASIVLIASLGGTHVFSGGNSIYGAAKAAMNSIMKFAAKEFAARKIRVNSICPGMVDTPMIHRGTLTEEQLRQDRERYPLKRYGKPEEVAHCAVFLLSNASSWMTGSDIILDGGLSI